MPTYQYVCSNPDGKHEFEVVQSFSDAALSECSTCGSPVRKVYGSVGVVFKGSGFYRTDSRSGSSSSDAPAAKAAGDSSPAAAKESGSSTSTSSTASTPSSSSGSGAKAAS